MITVKLTRIGNSVGVALPKTMLEHMRVEKGDTLYLTETPEGYLIRPYDPDFARQMEAGEIVMREDRDALRALAK